MIARTLVFGSPGKLSFRLDQLVYDGEGDVHRTIPIEDIGFVVLDNAQVVVTSTCLAKLAEANVAVVVCDGAHMPMASLLPHAAHTTAQETFSAQIAATAAVNGRLWRQIVRRKIENQAGLLRSLGLDVHARLSALADAVKNYDIANCEAQAARIYFQSMMPPGVNRNPDGEWPNCALNYGYAILRAAVARALVGSGLLCMKGIHHHNRYNAFCLADDVMEPYRPYVDRYVFGGMPPFDVQAVVLTTDMKRRLLQVLTSDVVMDGLRRPLMVALSYTTASIVRAYLGKDDRLVLPEFDG